MIIFGSSVQARYIQKNLIIASHGEDSYEPLKVDSPDKDRKDGSPSDDNSVALDEVILTIFKGRSAATSSSESDDDDERFLIVFSSFRDVNPPLFFVLSFDMGDSVQSKSSGKNNEDDMGLRNNTVLISM